MKKILYYIVFTLWYIISLLPLRVLYVLSDVLYLVLYRIVGYRRRTVWTNIVTAFPEMTAEEHQDVERGFYHFFCDYMVESIKLLTMSEAEIKTPNGVQKC